jgi:hypothetical protein
MRQFTFISLALAGFSTVTNAFQVIGTDFSTVVSQQLFSDGSEFFNQSKGSHMLTNYTRDLVPW